MTRRPAPRTASPAIAALGIVALTTPACREARSVDSGVEVVDSAGVELVRNAASDHALDLVLTPELTLGGEDTATESFYVVSRPTVATDGDGRISVLDRDNHRVLVFDADGRHLRTLGGEGDGPGELGWPTAISAAPDGRVFVFDIAKRGLVAWDAAGEPVEAPRMPSGFFGRDLAVDGAGFLLSVDRAEPFESHLLRYVPGGDTTVVVRVPRPATKAIQLESCGMGFSGMPPLLSPDLVWAAGGGLVAVATGTGYDVDLYRDGRLVRRVHRTVAPRPGTPELAAAEVGEEGMRVGTEGGVRVCRTSEVVEQRGFAEIVPAIRDLALGPDGSLWVQRYTVGHEPTVVDLFGPDGSYQGTLPAGTRLPVGFLPDGRVLVSETDELDVQRLVVTRMAAPWS